MAWDIAAYRLSLLVFMTLIAAGCFTWVALRSRGVVAEVQSRFISTPTVLAYGIMALGFALSAAVRLLTGDEDTGFLVMVAVWVTAIFAIPWFTPIKQRRSDGSPPDHVPRE